MQPQSDLPIPEPSFPEELRSSGVPGDQLVAPIRPVIEQAQAAFRRALPQLARERPGQWVAYHGDRLLGFAQTKTELYQRCLQQGYPRGQFLVRAIRPQPAAPDLRGPFEA